MTKYVLASGSPRRIELLGRIGITDFTVMPSNIDEVIPDGLSPEDTVSGLALQKAQSVAAAILPGSPLIIAADTMVYIENTALGKPSDAADAVSMLKSLSGRRHSVYTGIALLQSGRYVTGAEKTDVFFRELSDAEIEAYVQSGEPMDKAGAYAAQEGAAVFIERIEGDFWNVVGLPLCRLSLMLKSFGAEPGHLGTGHLGTVPK